MLFFWPIDGNFKWLLLQIVISLSFSLKDCFEIIKFSCVNRHVSHFLVTPCMFSIVRMTGEFSVENISEFKIWMSIMYKKGIIIHIINRLRKSVYIIHSSPLYLVYFRLNFVLLSSEKMLFMHLVTGRNMHVTYHSFELYIVRPWNHLSKMYVLWCMYLKCDLFLYLPEHDVSN